MPSPSFFPLQVEPKNYGAADADDDARCLVLIVPSHPQPQVSQW